MSPLSSQAQSDPYPNRPLTLVVPFAAGGGTDGTARVFAAALGQQLGQGHRCWWLLKVALYDRVAVTVHEVVLVQLRIRLLRLV